MDEEKKKEIERIRAMKAQMVKDKMLEEMFGKGYMYCKKHDTFYPVMYTGCPVCQLLGGVELVFENLERDLKSGTNVLKEWKKTRFGDV